MELATLTALAAVAAGEVAWGGVPIGLTISGLSTVVENMYADYAAALLFDNGQEFEATLLSEWSVEPDTCMHTSTTLGA